MTTRYSPHFTREEMLRSPRAKRLGIKNTPTPEVEDNLRKHCAWLELFRDRWGPWEVTSGYRSPAVNAATAGASKTSAHMNGCASDGRPYRRRATCVMVMDWLLDRGPMGAPEELRAQLDQAILYPAVPGRRARLHLGNARPGKRPRHQLRVKVSDQARLVPYARWREDNFRAQAHNRPEGAKEQR